MKDPTKDGFLEIAHTADVALEVYGETLPAVFKNAARGMYALMSVVYGEKLSEKVNIELQGIDVELILIDFLNELLYHLDKGIVLFPQRTTLSGEGFKTVMKANALIKRERYIKAATFHNLSLLETKNGYKAVIVFDI